MRLIVRSELRLRWRSLVFVALVVAFGGAVTLAAAAGARRTSTSFERFQESSRNHDVLVFAQDTGPSDVERLRSLPGVAGVGYARQFALVRPNGEFLTVVGPLDDALVRDVDRMRIVDGRAPARDVPEEVVIGEALARTTHLGPGDAVRVGSFTQDQIDSTPDDAPIPAPMGPELELRVVGISRLPIDLGVQGAEDGALILPRAFVERYGSEIGDLSGAGVAMLLVRLDAGAEGVDRFLEQLRAVLSDRPFDVDPGALTVGGVQESIDVLAIGILVFGVIAGAASLIALGLIISRQVTLLAAGQVALRDLGLPRRLRAVAIAGPLVPAIAVGALVAVLVAWAASPLMPFGVAGRAEPDPGTSFDALALGAGAFAIVIVLGAVAVVTASRVAGRTQTDDRARRRPTWLTRFLEAAGLGPPATIGVGMALQPGRGHDAVPVRSSLMGVAVAVFGVAAVVVFSASLDRLADTSSAYGRNWDVQVTENRPNIDELTCDRIPTRLSDQPGVDAIARVCSVSIELDGRAVGGVALRSIRGSIQPTVLEGRAAHGRHEVALGSDTLDALGARIGDRVTGESPAGRFEYRVVGRVVVPASFDAQAVADGAAFTAAGFDRLSHPGVSSSSSLAVRFRAGVDPVRATRRIDRLEDVDVIRSAPPLEVERLQQVDRLPIALAAFLGILGAIALVHLLVTCVQRRRHEFAVLKALGFRRSQFAATLAAQATTVACVGLALGLAAGTAAGAALWRVTAERVGVLPQVAVPILVLMGIALATVLIANAVAAFPARIAARTNPAAELRSE